MEILWPDHFYNIWEKTLQKLESLPYPESIHYGVKNYNFVHVFFSCFLMEKEK